MLFRSSICALCFDSFVFTVSLADAVAITVVFARMTGAGRARGRVSFGRTQTKMCCCHSTLE